MSIKYYIVKHFLLQDCNNEPVKYITRNMQTDLPTGQRPRGHQWSIHVAVHGCSNTGPPQIHDLVDEAIASPMHMVCRHVVEPACTCWVGGTAWSKHSLTTLGYCGIPVMGLCGSLGSIAVYVAPMATSVQIIDNANEWVINDRNPNAKRCQMWQNELMWFDLIWASHMFCWVATLFFFKLIWSATCLGLASRRSRAAWGRSGIWIRRRSSSKRLLVRVQWIGCG